MSIDEIIQQRIEKTEYQDEQILRMESLYFLDQFIIEYDYYDNKNVELLFKSCFQINFSHYVHYSKDINYKDDAAKVPYWLQDIKVSHENDLLKFTINAFPLNLVILCKDIEIRYKEKDI